MDANTNENMLLLRSRLNRMSSLLEGISEYSRSGRIEEVQEDIDLNLLVSALLETIEPPQGFVVNIISLPVIKSEHTRIYKIFQNLISNAIVHHHHRGEGRVEISGEKHENGYHFYIADNGPGIKPQYQATFLNFSELLNPKMKKKLPV